MGKIILIKLITVLTMLWNCNTSVRWFIVAGNSLPRKTTCHDLFITYVYVRSGYLISRQFSQKGEWSDLNFLTVFVIFHLLFLFVPLHMFVRDSLSPLMQLTPEEEQRRKLRRERNKVAASKCRMKRKEHVNTLRQVSFSWISDYQLSHILGKWL